MISLGKSEKFFLKNFCKIKSEKYLTKLTRPLIFNELGCQNREKINEKLTRALTVNVLGLGRGKGGSYCLGVGVGALVALFV